MNILCLATYSGDDIFEHNPAFAASMPQGHRFISNIIHCLNLIPEADVLSYGIAAYPSTFPHKGTPIRGKSLSESKDIINVSFLNVFGIKSISVYSALKRNTRQIESFLGPQTIVIASEAFTPYVKYATFLKHKYGCKTVLATPDLPEFMSLKKQNFLYRLLKPADIKTFYKYTSSFDAYLPIAQGIDQKINPSGKPSMLLDGMVREEDLNPSFSIENPHRFYYGGSLHYQFDIQDLLDAFTIVQSAIPDASLVICGDGEAAAQIKDLAMTNPAIQFHGLVRRNESIDIERTSGVLVNPRRPHDFTCYSFPSKTIEYLASGKPVVAYHLDGIGLAYRPYLRSPDSIGVKPLADAMIAACKLDEAQRKELFANQIQFIKNHNGLPMFSKKLENFFGKL